MASNAQRGPNKWEAEYAQTVLEPGRLTGATRWYGFEAIKLRLAAATFYTPDFTVITGQWFVEFHEIKGFWRDDAIVKFKIAAEKFPFARFLALRKRPVKEGGGWEVIKDLNG